MSDRAWVDDSAGGGAAPEDSAGSVEEYLDGRLRGDRLTAFERSTEASLALEAEVRLGRRIDDGLRRAFRPCAADATDVADRMRVGPEAGNRTSAVGAPRLGPRLRPTIGLWSRLVPGASAATIAAAASIAAVVAIAAVVIWQSSRSTVAPRQLITEPAALHAALVADGFKPTWVCTDDREFLQYTLDSVGESFLIRTDVPVEVLGWAYAGPFLGARTSMLLSRVEGMPVVLLVDHLASDRELTVPPESGLHLFRREFGSAVAYEISPRPEPVLLPAMEFPSPEAP